MAITLQLISDVNITPLAGHLANIAGIEKVETAPYGQLFPTLQSPRPDLWGRVVWTLAERSLPSFARALQLQEIDRAACLQEVDQFAEALIKGAGNGYLFVASLVMPPEHRGYGVLDWKPGLGIAHLLAEMNLRLAERLSNHPTIFLLPAERWTLGIAKPTAPKLWYATKVPYAPQVFANAAQDIAAAIDAITAKSRRLIVLDLDNTLWGGVIGETGWEGVRLGGHDHVGEAFKDFQTALKALSNKGIQLAMVSKNDESVALEALDHHPEMQLRRNDFAGWRINWNDKAQNILSLVEELNLGLASVIFIDDNPAERDRVREAIPELLVPEWPVDPTLYTSALHALRCFDTATISSEDRARTGMYVADRARRESATTVDSTDAWLERLGTVLTISPLTNANKARVTQLFNKTNQLNLSTRRLSQEEIEAWVKEPNHKLMTVSARDQFGDLGLVGILTVAVEGTRGQLTDFVLSCRVMGRMVEETLLHLAAEEAKKLGATMLHIDYLPTKRNRPTLEVLQKAKLTEVSPEHYVIDLNTGYAKPQWVDVQHEG